MARGDYGPEIKNAIGSAPKGKPRIGAPGSSAADKARDVGKGIKEGSAQDMKLDALPGNRAPAQGGSAPPDLHHVAAATSIAHAILGRAGAGAGGGGGRGVM